MIGMKCFHTHLVRAFTNATPYYLVFEMEVVTFKSKDFIIKGLKGYKTG
jgi:hypothetical protein